METAKPLDHNETYFSIHDLEKPLMAKENKRRAKHGLRPIRTIVTAELLRVMFWNGTRKVKGLDAKVLLTRVIGPGGYRTGMQFLLSREALYTVCAAHKINPQTLDLFEIDKRQYVQTPLAYHLGKEQRNAIGLGTSRAPRNARSSTRRRGSLLACSAAIDILANRVRGGESSHQDVVAGQAVAAVLAAPGCADTDGQPGAGGEGEGQSVAANPKRGISSQGCTDATAPASGTETGTDAVPAVRMADQGQRVAKKFAPIGSAAWAWETKVAPVDGHVVFAQTPVQQSQPADQSSDTDTTARGHILSGGETSDKHLHIAFLKQGLRASADGIQCHDCNLFFSKDRRAFGLIEALDDCAYVSPELAEFSKGMRCWVCDECAQQRAARGCPVTCAITSRVTPLNASCGDFPHSADLSTGYVVTENEETIMSKELQVFTNGEFEIKALVDESGKVWFPATETARVLGYTNPAEAVRDHCSDKGCAFRSPLTNGGVQQVKFIDEPNLYRLIMKSKLPSAEKFQDWVCEEVLPAIRKTGQYQTKPVSAVDLFQAQLEVMREQERAIAEQAAKIASVQVEVKQLRKDMPTKDDLNAMYTKSIHDKAAAKDMPAHLIKISELSERLGHAINDKVLRVAYDRLDHPRGDWSYTDDAGHPWQVSCFERDTIGETEQLFIDSITIFKETKTGTNYKARSDYYMENGKHKTFFIKKAIADNDPVRFGSMIKAFRKLSSGLRPIK